MANEDLLLYVRRASPRQVTTAVVVAVALFVAFLATIPFRNAALPQYNAVVPVIDTVLMLGDGITAALLFSQASVLRSKALIALAAGFLCSAILIVPHALTFPGAFAPEGLIHGGVNTTAWLYLVWHSVLPVSVIAYAILRRQPENPQGARRPMGQTIAISAAASVAAAAIATLTATTGHALLPTLMVDPILWSQGRISLLALAVALLLLVAMAMIARGRLTLIDIWLLVAMWAWLLELLLLVSTSARFNLAWYVGRVAGMLSGVLVLLALLTETSRLYTQLALSAAAEQQQREGRLMSLDAAASAIAHEVKQPITAMVTNAAAALIRIEKDPPDLPKVAHALRLIVADGHRAADTIAGIRALFGQHEAAEELVDLNQLIGETLDQRSVEISSRAIVTTRDLDPDLPRLPVRPQQMRQVFVNLLNNAIDALGERPAGPRRIAIRSAATGDGGVAIDIGDTGRGIQASQAERIFDAFFTTKTYGTGMGLPLCRSIVEGHGGKLSVTSVEGRGTTFHVLLPGPQG